MYILGYIIYWAPCYRFRQEELRGFRAAIKVLGISFVSAKLSLFVFTQHDHLFARHHGSKIQESYHGIRHNSGFFGQTCPQSQRFPEIPRVCLADRQATLMPSPPQPGHYARVGAIWSRSRQKIGWMKMSNILILANKNGETTTNGM